MKKLTKFLTVAISTASILLSACSSNSGTDMKRTYEKMDSDSLYVKKVENMSDDFILGMDISSVISMENSGVKYYDYDGTEKDIFEIVSVSGVNYIRVRVWNDPFDSDGNGYGGGNNDIDTAIEIGKRATKYKMKLLVDFHYSDFWADPSKQQAPKAWKGLDLEEKEQKAYEFTKDCLQKLKKAGVVVGMVQVGNETNGKLAGETTWRGIAHIMKSGSKAVREVYKDALVAVHFANPEKVTNYPDYASKLAYYDVDYDVFGSSYYPYWHGTLDNLSTVLSNVATTYGKKTMVMETSYSYRGDDTDFHGNTIGDGTVGITKDYPFTIQGQANCMRNIIDTVVNKTTNGIGVCYWEPAWITVGGSSWEENSAKWEKYGSGWAASYSKDYDPNDAGKYYGGSAVDNQAFFDPTGKALESLKVWNLVRFGNEIEIKPDAIADTNLTVDLAETPVLPTTVNAVMTDDSKQAVSVTWNVTEAELKDMQNHGPATYTVYGTAGGMKATCNINMIEYNYLTNHSFEDDASGTRVPTGWTVNEYGSANELYVAKDTTNVPTGGENNSYHFWGSASNSINFDLEQTLTSATLPNGTYKFSMQLQGGDYGDYNAYIYVKQGTEVKTQAMTMNGWSNWDKEWIRDIEYTGGDITVGIHVECAGSGNGAWGNIDLALLNSQND